MPDSTPRLLAPAPRGEIVPAKQPEFSIIVPAYQSADTIAEAVESALAQTYPAKEIVICDDGSTDDLAGALSPYLDRVTLVRQENAGPSAARNTAAATASGEFIVGLDADDLLLPGNLAARAEALAMRPDLDIVCTDAKVELEGQVLRQMYRWDWRFETDDQRVAILERCFVGTFWAVRRSRLLEVGGFDEAITHCEDWELWIRLILSGSLAGLVEAPLARYRLHQGSQSNQLVGLARSRLATMEKSLRTADLSELERTGLQARIVAEKRELSLARVREALLSRSPEARRESRRLLLEPGVSLGIRLRAALSWLSPRLARRALARRGRLTGAGISLPVD
jgi:glycosyltransferase involved in cell wall biosynthesis